MSCGELGCESLGLQGKSLDYVGEKEGFTNFGIFYPNCTPKLNQITMVPKSTLNSIMWIALLMKLTCRSQLLHMRYLDQISIVPSTR